MKIGIAGTGRMGSAIARRLLGASREVIVWNRTQEKTKPLEMAGAKVVATPAQLAGQSDIVITIVTDAAAIDGIYRQMLGADVSGRLFIEMSTVRPETEAAVAEKVKAKGAAMVDCPVGGSVGPAKEGKLLGFVGGDEADVARARPILDLLCRRVEHVGPVGAGARMKLAINLPLLVYWQALSEALALCAPLRLDPARVIDILADTSGGPNMLKTRGASIAATLAGKETTPVTVDIDTMRKDLRTMVDEARSRGFELPVTSSVLECFDAAVKEGWGSRDVTMFPTRFLNRIRGS